MPSILDAAIGTFFVFLLFSLVVSALNEYLLSLFDQRAKFLRMGLMELLGLSGGNAARPSSKWQAFIHFLRWIWASIRTLGGLYQPKESPPLMIGSKDLLKHGLINAYSRSDNGTTSPSYIPPGALVTALLDIVLHSPPDIGAAPRNNTVPDIAKILAEIHTQIRDASLSAPADPTSEKYTALINRIQSLHSEMYSGNSADSGKPLANVLFEFSRLAANERTRGNARTRLLAGDITTVPHAKAAIEEMRYDFKEELLSIAGAAGDDIGKFRTSIESWFSVQDSLMRLERMATCHPANPTPLNAAIVELKLGTLSNPQLGQSLLALFHAAGRDMSKFKVGIEGWFNGVMDRVSGWYKRYTQKWTIALAFILAMVFNVDTLTIVRTLSINPNLARAVAQNAGIYVSDNKRPLTAQELEKLRNDRKEALERAEKNQETVNQAPATADAEGDAENKNEARDAVAQARADLGSLEAYRLAVTQLTGSGLPIGWTEDQRASFFKPGWHHAAMITGWFLTAIAASLGAPFWFDLLNRFINARAAGRPPGEKDVTSTPVQPPSTALNQTPGTQAVR